MKFTDRQLINEALDCLVINAINMSAYADTPKEFRYMWRRKVEQINEIQREFSNTTTPTIEVKLKTIDIIDTNHSISKMIAEKVESVEGLGRKKFNIEIETEVEDLFFYATGSILREGHKSEPNAFTLDYVSLDLELTCNYEGYDVDFNIINDGKIEDTENYIVNLINK